MADDRWQAVFEAEHHRLFRSLLAHTGDPDLAADAEAEAEAFAQALRRGAAVRDPAAWVWRSAFRFATGLLHDRRHQADEISSCPPDACRPRLAARRGRSPARRHVPRAHRAGARPHRDLHPGTD